MRSSTLSVFDYVVLIILLLLSALIGIIFGFVKSKKASSEEFFLADGKMHMFPTALSITVSFLSAITILGTPSEVYMSGTMFWYQAAAWSIASMITAFVFMPKFREMKFTSIYQYLEKRFGQSVRSCTSITFTVYMFIYMALVLYAPALALSQTTGLNKWLSVVSISAVCIFYSSVGGMKAIIWTDVLQALVMYAGVFIGVIQGLILVGGFERAFSIAHQGYRIEFDNISFDPRTRHTVWSLLIGNSFNALLTYGFNQMQVQRYMCVQSTREAQKALLVNIVGVTSLILLSCLMGVILYAYYVGCDPYTAGRIQNVDQLLPYFIMETVGHKKGVPGLFLACAFSGSLSTISSGLNSMAAVMIEDVYKGVMRRNLNREHQGIVSKIVSMFIGLVIVLLTYFVSHLGSVINAAISLSSTLCGPIMGVFFLGFFFPRANRLGALVGFFVSLVFQLWIFIGVQVTKHQLSNHRLPLSILNCTDIGTLPMLNRTTSTSGHVESNLLLSLYSISHMWYTPIAVGTVVIVGIIVSYLFHPLKSNEIDSKLIIRIHDIRAYCRWSNKGRKSNNCVVFNAADDRQDILLS
ncbi:unnamed protein product [Adineta ricciae]|uniref:Uncharacterized protein n=1 Tax=Adineta ricciae TaxID=249248 RepID=A0A815NRK3_ADIRI|nr:unnamed protein product [Adineta ricciae]CAF1437346.1 unnamed protein product [Adineta ricciae]